MHTTDTESLKHKEGKLSAQKLMGRGESKAKQKRWKRIRNQTIKPELINLHPIRLPEPESERRQARTLHDQSFIQLLVC